MKKFSIPITLLSLLIASSAQALQVDPVSIPRTIQYTIVIKESGQDETRSVLTTIAGKEVFAKFTKTGSYIKSTTGDEILQGSIETGYSFRLTPTITKDEAAINTHFFFETQELPHSGLAIPAQSANSLSIRTTRIDNEFALADGETLTFTMDQDQQVRYPTITTSGASAPDSKRFISVTVRKVNP